MNLFAPVVDRREEFSEHLIQNREYRLERIVSFGHSSPPDFWYDQSENEWVAVLRGGAQLTLREPDEVVRLMPGDHLLIVAHRQHRVDWTSPDEETVWLALFYR